MRAPPSSNDFAKYVGFVTLLSNPKELSKNIKQFNEAQQDYEEARKGYDDAVKIAKTVDIAEALKLANEEEAFRLKTLGKSLYDKEKAVDDLLAKKHTNFKSETRRVAAELNTKQSQFDQEVTNRNAELEAWDVRLNKRESVLADDLARLEKEKRVFKDKVTRVEQAYKAA